jgi:hypothetical protein
LIVASRRPNAAATSATAVTVRYHRHSRRRRYCRCCFVINWNIWIEPRHRG